MSDAFVPDVGDTKKFTDWYQAHMASMNQATRDRYQPYIDKLTSVNNSWVGWNDPANQYHNQYNVQKTGMEALLARLGSGPQTSDLQAAGNDVASLYGYSPASWTAIQQGMGDRVNASNVMTNAGNIATDMANSAFGQQQAQAMRVAQRTASEQVGRQLESVFGARGGLAGFQAAYDMTSQMQNTMVAEVAKNSLDMLDRGLAQVNSENQYYQQLVQNGAIQAQDYLKFRWSALQTGYQDYLVAMDQTLKENATAQEDIAKQIDAITAQMAAEMGVDDQIVKDANAWWTLWNDMAITFEEVNGKQQAAAPEPGGHGPGTDQNGSNGSEGRSPGGGGGQSGPGTGAGGNVGANGDRGGHDVGGMPW
jgi:hypothetical protein